MKMEEKRATNDRFTYVDWNIPYPQNCRETFHYPIPNGEKTYVKYGKLQNILETIR